MTSPATQALQLGLDAGGTQTRWAVADASGALQAEGIAASLGGLQLHSAEGREHWRATLADIAQATGPLRSALAGVTGLDDAQAALLRELAAAADRKSVV